MMYLHETHFFSNVQKTHETIESEWAHPYWEFPGGPVVESLPYNAVDMGLIPGWGTKIPHAGGQLSPCAASEPVGLNYRAHALWGPCTITREKTLCCNWEPECLSQELKQAKINTQIWKQTHFFPTERWIPSLLPWDLGSLATQLPESSGNNDHTQETGIPRSSWVLTVLPGWQEVQAAFGETHAERTEAPSPARLSPGDSQHSSGPVWEVDPLAWPSSLSWLCTKEGNSLHQGTFKM